MLKSIEKENTVQRKNIKIDYVIEKASIVRLIDVYIPEITGHKVDRLIFNNWKRDLHDVRNDIIHQGALGHSKNQAEKASEAVSKMIYHIGNIK